MSTIVEGQGLNITVQSYRDTLDFGLVAARELVPDLDDLADFIVDEVRALAEATGVAKPKAGQPTAKAAKPAAKGAKPTAKSAKPRGRKAAAARTQPRPA